MKKILLVATGLGTGGAERLVVNLADYFSSQGHQVTLAYMTDKDGIFFRPKDKKINLVDLKVSKSPLGFIKGLKNFISLTKEIKPDVIHSHMYHANIFTRIARIFTPMKKLISSAHNTNEGGKLRMIAYRVTDSIPDISTNVSDEALTAFIDKKATKPGRMISIANGIDTNYFSFNNESRAKVREMIGINRNENMLLAAGRLTEAKDYQNLFHALKKSLNEKIDIKLAIAGVGPLEEELKTLSKKLGLEKKILFLGAYSDMPSLMSGADCFVLSSLWEGFGLVVAEAMACERVVVATDCGGVKEVLGDCGFLLPKGNSDLLAENIINALTLDKAEKDALGKRARTRVVEHFSIEKNAEKYFNIY